MREDISPGFISNGQAEFLIDEIVKKLWRGLFVYTIMWKNTILSCSVNTMILLPVKGKNLHKGNPSSTVIEGL
jgi:hypothetical protein